MVKRRKMAESKGKNNYNHVSHEKRQRRGQTLRQRVKIMVRVGGWRQGGGWGERPVRV